MVFAAAVSCQKNVVPETSVQDPEYVEVQLGLGGELEITYEPMTRGTDNNDLYGIQVYSASKDQEKPTWSYYAYGLFNDVNDLTVSLLKGFQYKFVATMVVDGKEKIKQHTGGYNSPFYIGGNSRLGTVDNLFIYTNSEHLYDPSRGYSYIQGLAGTYNHPNTDRYYGELTGYVPEDSSNDKAKIKMVRTSFQATFQAQGKLAVAGTLEILMNEAPAIIMDLTKKKKHTDYYTFSNVKAAHDYKTGNYSEDIDVSINWYYQNEDGSTVTIPLGTHKIEYARVRNTVLHINLENTNVDGGIGFELTEAGEMAAGAEYTINDGGNIDTEIDPNK